MTRKLVNPYPSTSLENAYEYIRIINKTLGDKGIFSRDAILKALNKKPSGTNSNIVGSLVHYGLLEWADRREYRVPKRTKELLGLIRNSPAWKARIKKFATKPELYTYLYKHYKDASADDITGHLIRKYKDRNINTKNIEAILKNYYDALRFAGITETAKTDTHETSLKHAFTINPDERKDIVIDNNYTVSIAKRYLYEAYKKTLEDDLRLTQQKLNDL